jgi:hypothetical protein
MKRHYILSEMDDDRPFAVVKNIDSTNLSSDNEKLTKKLCQAVDEEFYGNGTVRILKGSFNMRDEFYATVSITALADETDKESEEIRDIEIQTCEIY